MDSVSYKFLALLRGINVGGKNIISKDSLRSAFEEMGFTNVRTYIQSGNILFRSSDNDAETLTKKIETILSRKYSYNARATVISENQFKSIIKNAPENWGKDPNFRHRILFTIGDITTSEILGEIDSPNTEIETITTGQNVIYSSTSKKHLPKSVLMKISRMPSYQMITVRNNNTVFKLGKMFNEL